jgi:hypothetical protein
MRGYLRPGLWLIMICFGNVAAARASVAFTGIDPSFDLSAGRLGITVSSGFTAYTWGALAFEVTVTVLAAIALIQTRKSG